MEAPGEKLVTRLWETVEKTIGTVFRPWVVRRESRALAEAKRDELLMLAEAEHDAEELRSGRARLGPDRRLIPPPSEPAPTILPVPVAAELLPGADQARPKAIPGVDYEVMVQ